MWVTLLIWLAELIIKIIGQSNIELREKLAQSIKRKEEYEAMWKVVANEIAELDSSIIQLNTVKEGVLKELTDIEFEVDEISKKKERMLNEYKEGIDALADAVAVRSEL